MDTEYKNNGNSKYGLEAMREARDKFYDYFVKYAKASPMEAINFLKLTDDISRDVTGTIDSSRPNLFRSIIDLAENAGKSPYILLGSIFQGNPTGKILKRQLIDGIDGYHHKLLPEVINMNPKRPKPVKGLRYPSRLESLANQ